MSVRGYGRTRFRLWKSIVSDIILNPPPGNSIVVVEISHKNEISHKFKIIEDRKNKENILIKTSSSGDNQNYEHGYGHEPVHVCESIDRTNPYPDSEVIKHSIEELNCEIKDKTKKPGSSLHALAIMLPGSPYAEDKERRLRTRYAVVSALAENGYVPNDPEHIDFIDFDKTCKAVLRELRGNELAETEKKLSADKRKTLEEKTRFCHMGAFMPYEWFKHQDKDKDKDKDKDRHTILVLWLDDNGFSGTQAPLRTLGFLREKINGIDPQNNKHHFSVIGPHGSAPLDVMYREIAGLDKDVTQESDYKALENNFIYAAVATANKKDLNYDYEKYTKNGIQDWIWNYKDPFNIKKIKENKDWLDKKIIRTISTQDKLVDTLLDELVLRSINPYPKKTADEKNCKNSSESFLKGSDQDHIVLIGERDTFYSRKLTDSFLEKIDPCKNFRRVHTFYYLRGLDGITYEPSSAQKENENRNKESQANKLNDKEIKEQLERPVGPSQLDYLLNLAEQLRQLHRRLAGEGGIKAIGITGSDTYDKLLILQALRNKFPETLFFTTDLDARLLHPTEIKWTRNLLVASPFGLQLNKQLQQHTPPFRDNYQTSLYMTTRFALCAATKGELGSCDNLNLNVMATNWTNSPRLFEIGNYGAVNISHTPNFYTDPIYARSQTDRPFLLQSFTINNDEVLIPKNFLGTILGLAILLFILEHFIPRKSHIHLWIIISTAALLVFALFCLYLERAFSYTTEPLSFTNGTSIWPTNGILLLSSILTIYLFCIIYKQLINNEKDIESNYSCACKNNADDSKETKIGRHIDEWSICPSKKSHQFGDLWSYYLKLNSPPHLYKRLSCILFFFLSLIAVWFIFITGSPPLPPFRGEGGPYFYYFILAFTAFVYLSLILYIADKTHSNCHFIRLVANHDIEWSPDLVKNYNNRYKMPGRIIKNKILMDFINQHTDAYNKFIYYPFYPLFLIIISHNYYFDNWPTTPFMLFVYIFLASITLISAIRLRAAAQYARKQILKKLGDNSSKLPILEILTYRQSNSSTKLKSLINEIADFREGIFRPLLHHPMLLSLLMPLSSIGGIYLIEYLT